MKGDTCERRLSLRALEPEDLDFLYTIENDEDMWDMGCANVPYSRYALSNYILSGTCDIYADKQMRLLMQDEEGAPVGLLDLFNFDPKHLRAEVGIAVDRHRRDLGYGHEALLQIEKYARHTLHLHQLYAIVVCSNVRSLTMFRKAGFVDGALLKDWVFDGKNYQDALVMQFFL